MKNLKMFAIAVMAFAVMAMGVHAAACTTDCVSVKKGTVTTDYSNIQAALSAMASEEDPFTIIVNGDFDETISSGQISITQDVTIDLGEHTVTLKTNNIWVEGGSLTLKGTKGTLTNEATATRTMLVVKGQNSKLTIEKGVTVANIATSGAAGAVLVSGDSSSNSSKGSSLVIAGEVTSKTGHAVSTYGTLVGVTTKTAPVVTIEDGAKITSDGAAGLYLAGYAVTTVGKATITGDTGIGIKTGVLTLNGPTVTGNGDFAAVTPVTGGLNSVGAAVHVEGNTDYNGTAKVIFNGGEYTSENGNAVVLDYATKAALTDDSVIKDGTFTSGETADGKQLENIAIIFGNGGTVDEDTVNEYIAGLENLIAGGDYVGPVVGDIKVGDSGKVEAEDIQAKLIGDAKINTDDEGNTTVGEPTPGEPGTTEPGDQTTGDGNQGPTDNVKNPETNDNILVYAGLGLVSLASVAFTAKKRED